MKARKQYSWVFVFYNVLNGKVCYRLYHGLSVDDVDFLANEFCKANNGYSLGVFKFQFFKRSLFVK
jgi:hypothetical protein